MPSNGFLNEQGLAIRSARLARSMTQSVLAESAGVSEKTIRRAEAGERLQAETVLGICSVLGLDPANLRSEAEMDPRAETDRRRQRIRVGILTAAMALSLVAASLTGVQIARDGGGYKDALAITLDNPWINAWVLGFGFVNLLPMYRPVRNALGWIPGMADFGRKVAVLEPYGMAVTFVLLTFALATLLPFAVSDGWAAFQSGGRTGQVVSGLLISVMTPFIVVTLSGYIAGSDSWGKWTERRLARIAKAA